MQTMSLSAYAVKAYAQADVQARGGNGGEPSVGEPDAPFGVVTPQRLIALGIVANALFWSGLLMPFNGHATSEIAFLHAFVAMLGVALALGGAVALVLIAIHQVVTRLFSPEMIAGVLHFSVVIAFATLSFCAHLRGWNAGL